MKIPKKGDLTDCNNWQGITLLSVSGKVFCSIILHRIRTAIDRRLREEQNGFQIRTFMHRSNFALRNILEQCKEWQTPLILNFVDFQKAFDSVDRVALWNILRICGLPEKIINLITNLYDDSECTVLVDGEPTAPFKVKTGVRQGCILSSVLFCFAIDFVMRSHTAISSGIAWNGNDNKLGDLDFDDDVCLINSTHEEMQEKTTVLNQQAAKISLQINKRKIETLKNLKFDNNNPAKLHYDELNKVDKFTYLESIVTANGDCLADIKNRISKAVSAMNKLNNFRKNKNIEQKTKLQIFRTNVLPILLYGSET